MLNTVSAKAGSEAPPLPPQIEIEPSLDASPRLLVLVETYKKARKAAWIAIEAATKDEDDKALDKAAGRALRREEAAHRRVLQEPARTLGDFVEKFQILADVSADGFAISEEIGPLDAELRRLLGKSPRVYRGVDR